MVLILHNIRSTYNVGAILRTAEGFGIDKVICSGYTPWPYKLFDPSNLSEKQLRNEFLPHLADKLIAQIHKTALGAEEMLLIEWSDDIKGKLDELKKDYIVIGLENNIDRETISLSDPDLHKKTGENIALLLGEEVEGIPSELYGKIDEFVEIPMKGKKESFNVSVAAGIAMFALKNSARHECEHLA